MQGQLTCDLDKLAANHSISGAHCTPKGRAIANFRLLENADSSIDLIMPEQQLAATARSLGKYAPFFKVSVDTGNRHILGLAGPAAVQLCEMVIGVSPKAAYQAEHNRGNSAIQLDNSRCLLLLDPGQAEAAWDSLASNATPAGNPLWTLLDIRAGAGTVTAATREQFVPQMLNLQAIGDISFKKGCYTGQEVVARMRYLGKLKKRMYRLHLAAATPATAGQNCYIAGKSQSQGVVVSASNCDEQNVEALVVLTSAAADSEQLLIGDNFEAAQPIAVEQLPLPYSLDTGP